MNVANDNPNPILNVVVRHRKYFELSESDHYFSESEHSESEHGESEHSESEHSENISWTFRPLRKFTMEGKIFSGRMEPLWLKLELNKPTRVWAKVLGIPGVTDDELVPIEEVIRMDTRQERGFPVRRRMEEVGRYEYHPLNRNNYALTEFRKRARQAKGAEYQVEEMDKTDMDET